VQFKIFNLIKLPGIASSCLH